MKASDVTAQFRIGTHDFVYLLTNKRKLPDCRFKLFSKHSNIGWKNVLSEQSNLCLILLAIPGIKYLLFSVT